MSVQWPYQPDHETFPSDISLIHTPSLIVHFLSLSLALSSLSLSRILLTNSVSLENGSRFLFHWNSDSKIFFFSVFEIPCFHKLCSSSSSSVLLSVCLCL